MGLPYCTEGSRSFMELCYGLPLELWKERKLQCCIGCATAAWLGVALWKQYGVLRHGNLPRHDLGWPLIGQTSSVLSIGLEQWARRCAAGEDAFLTNYLFSNVVLVSYPLYKKFLHKAELDGRCVPAYPFSSSSILGSNSILFLPAGKGHERHRRLRGKILASLGQRQALALSEGLLGLIRATLDGMAAKTAAEGFSTFIDVALQMASRASALPITAGLDKDVQARLELALEEASAGISSIPINLGRLTQFGRSMRARQEVVQIISGLTQDPPEARQSTIADLMKASEEGSAFTLDEVVDTCFTLLIAGQLTTADTLPSLLVLLSSSPSWVQRIAEEPLQITSIEADSATLRFVREVMRLHPPVPRLRRACPAAAAQLGEHGHIPAGCPFSISLGAAMASMGDDFDPDRWTPEVAREKFLAFGGSQPHECVGKNLALLELQLFARVLCREYDFEALDVEPKPKLPFGTTYGNKLRVRVSGKPSA